MKKSPFRESDVTKSIVAVIGDKDNKPVGVGFIIADNQVLTCAHVVNVSLGRSLTEQTAPGVALRPKLILPLFEDGGGHPGSPTAKVSAEVLHWSPPGSEGFAAGDIACLEIPAGALPAPVTPLALADPGGSQGMPLDLFGYPTTPPRPMGAWTRCRLVNKVAGGLWQLDQDLQSALHVQPGYSGSPLWDPSRGAAVGMLVVAAVPGSSALNAYAIPSTRLLAEWPGGATEENLQRSIHFAIDKIEIRTKLARATADMDVDLSQRDCLQACYRSLSAVRLRSIRLDERRGIVEARTPVEMRTWGDKITITVTARSSGSHILICSEPVVKITLANYGVARRNIVRILTALSDALEDS